MFGETVESLIQYMTPVSEDSLGNYGFDDTEMTRLLAEKAGIVFSHLPPKYRSLYKPRVYRLVLEEFAYAGQVSKAAPFPDMSNIVGYLNPPDLLEEFTDAETLTITPSGGNLTFSARSKGDKVIIDFDNDMTDVEIPELAWPVKVLAAIDIAAVISGDLKTGDMVPRIKMDGDAIWPWLRALSNIERPGDRVIVEALEHKFWEGKKNFAQDIDSLMRHSAEGLTL